MKKSNNIQLLQNNIKDLLDAVKWLKRSYQICCSLEKKEIFSEIEFDNLEAMSARFSRVTDILIQKVFRSIDHVEMETQGSMIDVVNRAEKRKIISSVDLIREMKDLRNEITHEYVANELTRIFIDVIKYTPDLLKTVEDTITYCNKYK
ncbi:MAG: hypothetical protein GY756_08390 [bacterium]|nr:hypothetical protein [bacterium]